MSNNKQIQKHLELPHQETIVGINTIQTKPFDNQKTTTMSNNKQSSLDYYITKSIEILGPEINKQISRDDNERIARLEKQAKAMHEEELDVAYGNGYEQGEMDFYKKMQVKGDKYAEGYSEGYKRALELVKWKIDNDLQGGNK